MELTINPEFRDLLPPLTDDEKQVLRESLLEDSGHIEIVVWANHDNTILDGHNRYEICQGEGLEFKIRALAFDDEDHAKLWIFRNQTGRRNLTDEQRRQVRGNWYNLEKKLRGNPQFRQVVGIAESGETAEKIAVSEKVSSRTVERDAKRAKATNAAPAPIKQAILAESIKAKTEDIEAVNALPAAQRREVVALVEAGEVKSLGAALKQVAEPEDEAEEPKKWEARIEAYDEARKCLQVVIRTTKQEMDDEISGRHWLESRDRVRGYLDALESLKAIYLKLTPAADCNKCGGDSKKCTFCHGGGWLTHGTAKILGLLK